MINIRDKNGYFLCEMPENEWKAQTFEEVCFYEMPTRLESCRFSHCSFVGVFPGEIKSCWFDNCSFDKIHQMVKIEKAMFNECIFDEFQTLDSEFKNAEFQKSTFCISSFSLAHFIECYFRSESNLEGVGFTSSKFERTYFSNSNLNNARFTNSSFDACGFTVCEMVGVDFKEAWAKVFLKFSDCNLSGAEFTFTDMREATFKGCSTDKAVFKYACIDNLAHAGLPMSCDGSGIYCNRDFSLQLIYHLVAQFHLDGEIRNAIKPLIKYAEEFHHNIQPTSSRFWIEEEWDDTKRMNFFVRKGENNGIEA